MTTLRAVFWDVDGTLADTEMDGHRPAFNRAFADLGLAWHWDPELYSRLLAIPGGSRRVEAYAKEMRTVLTAEQLDRLRVQKRLHYLERIRQGCVGWRPGVKRLLFELDDAIEHVGFGRYQRRLLFVTGALFAGDAMVMMLVSFLMPAARCVASISRWRRGRSSPR